jgi:hypothetical protein
MRMENTPYDAAMTRSKQELARQLVDANVRIDQLEAALREISDDAERFGRVNHLYEKSAEIVARARAALAPEQDK